MPRTPSNRAAGNFMLAIDLLGPEASLIDIASANPSDVLATARRPAILTYYSDTMEHVHRASGLIWHMLGWRKEAEKIEVKMMEGVEFSRGWRNIPSAARLELQGDRSLQVYNASLAFTARLRGLRYESLPLPPTTYSLRIPQYTDLIRYIMYNYRIISFLVFTTAFWATEVIVAITIWSILSFVVFRKSTPAEQQQQEDKAADEAKIKREIKDEPDVSDTERTFPSTSRQHPLRYESPAVKSEEDVKPALADIPLAAEADVEDEDEDADFVLDDRAGLSQGFNDSGLGTSLESGAEKRDKVRRRRSGR